MKTQQLGEIDFCEYMKSSFLVQIRRIDTIASRLGNKMIHEAKIPVLLEQLPVLMTIYMGNTVSQQEIANLTQRHKASVQRTITYLNKEGLLNILQNETDKRINNVSLTKKGILVAEKIEKLMIEVDNKILSYFNKEKGKVIIHDLKTVAEKIETIL